MSSLISLALAVATVSLSPAPAETPARVEAPMVGFTNTAWQPPAVTSGANAAALQAAIAPQSVMRVALHWRSVQPQAGGPIDFADFDRQVIEPALALGLRPLIIVDAAPEWAWGLGACDPRNRAGRGFCIMPPGDDPANLRHWSRFVRAVAQHYGDRAAGIEVWNEENAGGFWNTIEPPDPDQYADLLCTAHDAVREVRPDLPVVLGGLAGKPTDERHLAPADYLAALYENQDHDVRDCISAIGVHAYPAQVAPTTPNSRFEQILAAVRAVRDEHDAGRPLWITEFGYFTRGGPGAVSEPEQAALLACSVGAVATMPDVEAFIVHTLVDRGGPDPAEGSFGVYAAPPESSEIRPKAAADVLRLVLSVPGGHTPPATC